MYQMHKIVNLLIINKIVTIHYFEFPRDYFFPGEHHDFWEVVYVDKGTAQIVADNSSFVLKQGEAYFHKPNEFHAIGSHASGAPNICVVTFVCKSAAMDYFFDKKAVLSIEEKHLMGSLIKEAKATFKMESFTPWLTEMSLLERGSLGGQQLIRCYLEQLLISLLRSEEKKEKAAYIFQSKEMMEDYVVAQIVEIMEQRLYTGLRISDLCEALNYGKTYLSTLFKQVSGFTIMEYYTNMQIKQAKVLIREGHHTFKEISEMLAFDNPNYFSRVFKRVTDMSPTEYKNSIVAIRK